MIKIVFHGWDGFNYEPIRWCPDGAWILRIGFASIFKTCKCDGKDLSTGNDKLDKALEGGLIPQSLSGRSDEQ